MVHFARYVPMVAALGARVILEVPGAIHSLMLGMSGVTHGVPRGFPMMPAFDVHCPLSSLPLAFRTRLETIPAPVAYLPAVPQASREEWQSRLGPHDRFRVGLVWSGNRVHKNDHNRSIALQALSPILDLDATFVSLQKDPRDQDMVFLRERAEILDVSEHLTDFVATAALVSCLDLVITVDTSVAHLVGALGLPGVDHAAVHARLPLAARSRRQPLVSDRASVPADRNARLRTRDRSHSDRAAESDRRVAARAGGGRSPSRAICIARRAGIDELSFAPARPPPSLGACWLQA